MDESLKQRLIGAFVLLALGVIFLPVLFEPDHRRNLDRTSQIPEAPAIEPVSIARAKRNTDIEAARPAEQMYTLSADARANQEAEAVPAEDGSAVNGDAEISVSTASETILDGKGVIRAWAVQVGSFKEAERAAALLEQLIGDGYQAYSRSTNTDKGRVTRIYVGPKVERSRAIELKRDLDRKLKLDTLIVIFTP